MFLAHCQDWYKIYKAPNNNWKLPWVWSQDKHLHQCPALI
jgi:hypothetical protein